MQYKSQTGEYVGGVCGANSYGGTITNCYYLTGCAKAGSVTHNGIGNNTNTPTPDTTGSTAGKTAAGFADGTVAWLLNTAGKNTADSDYEHSGVWSQGATYPIFADETNKAVYKVGITGAITKAFYLKSGGNFTMPEAIHVAAYTEPFTVTTDVAYTADAAITGVSPTVYDSITLKFEVKIANSLVESKTPTLDILFGDTRKTTTSESKVEGDYTTYTFTLSGILSQQMTRNISAKLMIDDTPYATKSEYSVKRYAFNRLSVSDNEVEKKFLVNMLYYGEAAQDYLGKETDLATEGLLSYLTAEVIADYLTSEAKWIAHPTEPLSSLVSVKDVTDTSENDLITWKSATLVFDTTITMRLRFTTTEANLAALTESNATFDVSFGDDIALSDAVLYTKAAADPNNVGSKTYYIDIKGFKPTDYETEVTVVLNNAGTPVSGTVHYSVMSYIENKKDSETMKTLVRALYDYGISGKAYAPPTE